MKFTKLNSVTLKMGHGDPYTILSKFSISGTYTPNFVILAHSLQVIAVMRVGRTDGRHADGMTDRQTDNIKTTIPVGQSFGRGVKITCPFTTSGHKECTCKKSGG